MRELLRKAISNTPAMNTLMIAVLIVGALSLFRLRREVFPEFQLEIVLVTVPYPGASPEEVEEAICQKIEEAVRSIDGIKKQTSVAKEGAGSLVLELSPSADPQKVLNEVRSEVDRIPSFPELAEDPEVKQITLRQPAITVGVVGPAGSGTVSELQLRELAESVRDELLRLPYVSQAAITGARDYEIDVEIPEETLRRYGLSLQQVAGIIRRENLELPAGTIRTDGQDVLVKGRNKSTLGRDIARIPVITLPNGTVLTVADLGSVRDEFADITSETLINGRPGFAIAVERTSTEDLLSMTEAVRGYVASKKMPYGCELLIWGDRSVEVKDRLELLAVNGLQGLVLVVVLLAIFLELKLALWVAAGIPISLLGACAALYFTGETLNMLTSFTFVMALGIVVDDAIVIGENIFSHRQMGKPALQAAIDGASEVLPSVISSVATTVVAFVPLMFVSGVMGKFIAVMPFTMISVLLISLVEASFVLPCHLAHESHRTDALDWSLKFRRRMPGLFRVTLGSLVVAAGFILSMLLYPLRYVSALALRANWYGAGLLNFTGERIYLPALRWSLGNKGTVISISVVMLMLTFALIKGGIVPFIIFPKLDANTIEASVTYPDGTPESVTRAAAQRIEEAILRVGERYRQQGSEILRLTRRSVGIITRQQQPGQPDFSNGAHLGGITAELTDTSLRTVRSDQIIADWRREAGEFPGAESVTFGTAEMGPGGKPVEFKLLARSDNVDALEAAVEAVKARLREFPGVFDIADDSSPGKWEFQLKIKEDAVAMGVPLAELAETVRASYYGAEVMRLQRGRHEVKLMVRYPRDARRSFAEFDQIRVRLADGAERPLTELADVKVDRGYSEINRVNQLRSITVTADLDEAQANARELVQNLQSDVMPALLEKYPGVSVRWEGQQEQTNESVASLIIGFIVALIAMFALLTLEFNSYFQPLLIMAIVPFGFVGAISGHALMGMPITLFSLFGLVALTGVVVNDSIVLIDFINQQVRSGTPLDEALINAGRRRLRPIFLTSVTTIAGLMPLLFETSFQAQILIPMAVSLCYGLMVSTVLCLIQVPVFYAIHASLTTDTSAKESASAQENAAGAMMAEAGAV